MSGHCYKLIFWGIYDQVNTTFIEKNLIDLAIKWNKMDSSTEFEKGRVQKGTEDTIYAVSIRVPWMSEGSSWQGISDTFQTKLQGLYGQDNSANKDRNFMELAKDWNDSGSQDKGSDLRLQNDAVYVVGKEEDDRTGVLSKNGGVADFQAGLQGLYGQPEEPNKEQDFMILAKNGTRLALQMRLVKGGYKMGMYM